MEDFQREVLEARGLTVVDFRAPRCSRCRAMELVLADVEQDGVRVVRIDVDKQPQLAKKYAVMSLPTVIVFLNGEVLEKRIGLCTHEDITDMLAI